MNRMNKPKNLYFRLNIVQKFIFFILISALIIFLYCILFPKEYTFNCSGQSEKYTYIEKPNASQQKEKTITEVKTFQITIYKYFFGLHHSIDDYKMYQCKKDWNNAIACIKEFVGEPFSSKISNNIHILKLTNSITYHPLGGVNNGGFSKIYNSKEYMEKTNGEVIDYSHNAITEKFTSKVCIQITNPLQN